MGRSDQKPDDHELLQKEIKLEVVKNYVCHPYCRSLSDIFVWKDYIFRFGVSLAELLKVNVSIKLYLLMRKVDQTLTHFGCIRRGSSEENEMAHKQLKSLYILNNKHIHLLGPQLL